MPKVQKIYGPPGTGKTRKLMDILKEELKTVPKNRIAFVSFTNKGVDEGIDRAREQFGGDAEDYPYFRTLHSLAFKTLGISYGSVMQKQHYKELSKLLGMNFLGYSSMDMIHNDDLYLQYEDLVRNSPRQAQKFRDENYATFDTVRSEFVHLNYARYKKANNLVDYTDMLTRFVEEAPPLPVDVAFVDEAQDLTDLQWEVVKVAFFNAKRMYVAGDDDQAIFTWAGASVEKFMQLKSDLPPIFLRKSYRLPQSIVTLAQDIITQNCVRIPKQFSSKGEVGLLETHNSFEEIVIKEKGTYLFLARNRKFLLPIEAWLKSKGEHFIGIDAEPVSLRTMKRAKEWEEYRKTATELPAKNTPLRQMLNENAKLDQSFWEAFSLPIEELDYMRQLYAKGFDGKKEPRIRVSTIHRMKGGEADNVVLLLDLARRTHLHYVDYPEDEVRTFYVGITRAKEELHIVFPSCPYGFSLVGSPLSMKQLAAEERRKKLEKEKKGEK